MQALTLHKFGEIPVISDVATPDPSKGEVLIKIDSSPINPSDLSFLRGEYSTQKVLPVIPGFEASGIVVATAHDFLSKRLLGKRVACFAPPDGNGTWAQYLKTRNNLVVPLKSTVDTEIGSMLLVNPLSVWAMIEIAKKRKVKAIANTAAASALGQLLNRQCQSEGIKLVNIVRKEHQVQLLKDQGSEYIINTSSKDYREKMKMLFRKLDVRMAFDAVAETAATIFSKPSPGKVR